MTTVAARRVRRPLPLATDDRWTAALADFSDAMIRAQLAASTVTRVCKHVRKFTAETGAEPYAVTPGTVTAWFDSLNVSAPAGYAYRTSLRTFYRWAHRAGRVPDNPTTAPAGPHPLAKPTPDGWAASLTSWRRWLFAGGRSRNTATVYTSHLHRLARQTGAEYPWALSTEDLTDWLARQRWQLETLRSASAALRSFYGWAYDLGLVDHNPAAHLPRLRAPQANPRPAGEDDYQAALDRATDPRDVLMLRLAAELGLRRGEVSRVHAADLTRDRDGLWWLAVLGKGHRRRRVPVPDELAGEIRRAAQDGYLFPGLEAGHLSAKHVGKRVSALLPPNVTMHALRHRFATLAYSVDRDVFTVQRLLGHARPDTTQRYVQTGDDAARRLVNIVSTTARG